MAKSCLPWIGGKCAQWKRLKDYLPYTDTFIDVFGGGGNVILNKHPESKKNIYNDKDGNIVNFFRVCRENTDELIRQLEFTPYSREEYENARQRLLVEKSVTDEMERARLFCVCLFQCFGKKIGEKQAWSKCQVKSSSGSNINTFNNIGDRIKLIASKFKNIHIENLDYSDLIDRYTYLNNESLLYVDPPYYGTDYYNISFSREDQENLIKKLHNHNGLVCISNYDSELYQDYLKDWVKIEWDYNTSLSWKNRKTVKECMWMNYKLDVFNNIIR